MAVDSDSDFGDIGQIAGVVHHPANIAQLVHEGRLDITVILYLLFCSGRLLEHVGDGPKHSLGRHVIAVVVVVDFAWIDAVAVAN